MRKGIDVSQYQGAIDWTLIAQQNFDFVVLRATLCLNSYRDNEYKDYRFEEYYAQAVANGLGNILEVYHVVTPFVSAETQYYWLANALRGKTVKAAWLDVERRDNQTPQAIADNVLGLLNLLETNKFATGVYTGAWFWNPYVARSSAWQSYALWVASYTDAPRIPLDWTAWHTWQYTSKGQIPGITENTVDLNWRQAPPPETGYITLEAGSEVCDSLGIDAQVSQLAQSKTIELNEAWVKDGDLWVRYRK